MQALFLPRIRLWLICDASYETIYPGLHQTKNKDSCLPAHVPVKQHTTPREAALNSWAAQTQNVYVDLEKCNETFQTSKFSIVTPLSHIFPEKQLLALLRVNTKVSQSKNLQLTSLKPFGIWL